MYISFVIFSFANILQTDNCLQYKVIISFKFAAFLISVCCLVTAHDYDEQHQELCVPSVWASPEFARLTWTPSSHPL